MSTENEVIVTTALKSASIEQRLQVIAETDPTHVPVFVDGSGQVRFAREVADAIASARTAPPRRSGNLWLTELDSFIGAVNRWKTKNTVVLADSKSFGLTAVYNAAPEGGDASAAGWGDDLAHYTCPRSDEWKAWTEREGKPMNQEAFANFVDERLADLTSSKGYPAPLEVLEMARNLLVRQQGTFQRTIDPTTGTGTLICKTEHGAESTKIHRAFMLALSVFEGGQKYGVEARVRFSLSEGRAAFAFDLHRRGEIERDAFGDVRKAVVDGCTVPVLAGKR